MADENLAPEEELQERTDAPVIEDTDDTPEPIANLARDLGWTPKTEWQGDPDKWKPAEQFIRDGRDIQQSTARELRSVREQLDRIGNVTTSIVRDKVAERDAYWKQQFNQAVEEGDTERAAELAAKCPTGEQQGPDPVAAAWVAKNEWFNTDPLAQARAKELSEKLSYLPVADQLAQVERAIRKEFPEHFPAPAKPAPATQTAQGRNAIPGNRVKGFADMPQASQQAAIEMERLNGVKRDDFAKHYWANEAKKGSRA